MQVELNPDGTRNTEYRPRILLEETTYNNVLYNPHDSHNYGLYQSDHHLHQSWVGHVADHVDALAPGGSVENVRPLDYTMQHPVYQSYAMGAAPQSNRAHMYRRLHST